MSNTTIIKERINALRGQLEKEGMAAAIINTGDPHLSEYIADHWKFREWLSGFTGSAGTLVVGLDWAGLWTDSRYHLQAAQQLEGTGIDLYKEGLTNTPDIATVLCEKLTRNSKVATDAQLFPVKAFASLTEKLRTKDISLFHNSNIYMVWGNRPPLPNNPIFVHELKYAGESASEKIAKIRSFAKSKGATVCLISGLDEIAWVLNLRGSDISYNPVFYAYLTIYTNNGRAYLYANNDETGRNLLSNTVLIDHLAECNVDLKDYSSFIDDINASKQKWCYNMEHTNAFVDMLLCTSRVADTTPAMQLKAIKNDIQIEGLRQAQLVDGVALTQAFCWLDKQMERGDKVTELSFANHLDHCREQQKDYFSLSFNTISAFAHHGAIVHYGVTPETDIPLEKGNFLLVDSGGNYLNGTTDITRTVCLGGSTTAQQRHDYTLVLKGHIALATTPFPENTSGAQLDTLARQFLWKDAKNYGHGTGHGIGHFLCVHEGPHRISILNNNVPLQPGMLISNEPGLYIEGQYGIRLENMVCVKGYCDNAFGKFLELETMSFFPFDSNAIDTAMLTDEELNWLNVYHETTYKLLSGTGLLNAEELEWLKNKTHQIIRQ
ncbi:MAG: aminopeptidase P family protein [Paludibacteraceae bacterium]|nr:aminopeptidase P family protein [Paludibacteraceae bacterium]